MTPIDFSFPVNYAVETDIDLPGDGRDVLYFPGGSTRGGHDGIAVRVTVDSGDEWTGIFEYGRLSPNGITGVWTMPHMDQVCVISRGNGFVVDVKRPRDFYKIAATPILHVLTVTDPQLLVVADDTRLQAIGKNGVAWETGRVSSDGITDVRVEGGLVLGVGWDSPNQRARPFSIDLISGRPLAAIRGRA